MTLQPLSHPPLTLEELLDRARLIAGLSLSELAHFANIIQPEDFRRHKGWTGQLIELWLGATAGSKPTQDFPDLGVELKTIPIDSHGRPLETTYVCYAPLMPNAGDSWETSNVRNKLNLVLWVPVEGERVIPVADRRVGMPFLWQPDEQQMQALSEDWHELTEMIISGQIERVTSRHGEVLQLRPKAANGSVLAEAIGEQGQIIQTRPRGFYLKKTFTEQILAQAFA